MKKLKESKMYEGSASPLVIEPVSDHHQELAELVELNSGVWSDKLLEHGALLFRGFSVWSVTDFDRFISALKHQRLEYFHGSTPRTALGNSIYTATEYPASEEIPLHNELSYETQWPLKLALCCLVPATFGGETPIASMRRVTAAIGAKLMDAFEERRVKYVRHYWPSVDVAWQKAFQTNDRVEVAKYCVAHEITHEWLRDGILRTYQVCQGTAHHPITNERLFFNQAHLFHVSSVGEHAAKLLTGFFGNDRLPRQTFYGDGREIPLEDLVAVRSAFSNEAQTFRWQAGDVLLLDNMQFAHGRRAFQGARHVIVGLMEPYSEKHGRPMHLKKSS